MICDNCIHDSVCGLEGHLDDALTFCADKVTNAQPIRRGRWIEDDNCFHHCSECKENTIRDTDSYGCECGEFLTDYCPNCGALMNE